MDKAIYKRIFVKVSGEALQGKNGERIDFNVVNSVCKVVKDCIDLGVEVGIMIGAGNFWRGAKDGAKVMQRSHADAMGMLGTVMNAIAMADAFEKMGIDARVLSAVEMNKFCEYFTRDRAERYLKKNKVVIFAAGTGNPYFSTDTGAVLRAIEIEADVVLMAKSVDGVYAEDPKKNPDAPKFDAITYEEVLEKKLKATDLTAMALALDNGLKMVVFELKEPENIIRAVCGDKIGTLVTVKEE